MTPPRRDDNLYGEVIVEFNGFAHKRAFCLTSALARLHGCKFEPQNWPTSPDGTRMLRSGMRDEVEYLVRKTASECLRHVLYELTGRF